MFIGLLGVRGSGKDHAAAILKKEYESKGLTVAIVGFSDGVRDVTFAKLGVEINSPEEYDRFKTEKHIQKGWCDTGRYWLEHYGEGLRNQFPLYWANYWTKTVSLKTHDVIIANDCRFTHEVMAIQGMAKERGVETKFLFCDYRSKRYDDTVCATNELALQIRKFKTPHGEDITKIFEL